MSDWSKYELLSDASPTSITWASIGGDGSGKSHFGCTSPAPIFVCGFDPHGMARVSKEVRAGKEIRIGRYGFNFAVHGDNKNKIGDAAQRVWQQFTTEYRIALKNCRTVLWDREDLAWELLRYATFGDQKNAGSKTGALEYGDLNAEYVSLIQEAKDANVNLGLLQGVKEKWVAKFDPTKGKMVNYATGEYVPDGFKKIADHVDITLTHFWDEKAKEYMVKIGKFPAKEYKDQAFPSLTFPMMALSAFPESTIDTWGE